MRTILLNPHISRLRYYFEETRSERLCYLFKASHSARVSWGLNSGLLVSKAVPLRVSLSYLSFESIAQVGVVFNVGFLSKLGSTKNLILTLNLAPHFPLLVTLSVLFQKVL